MALPEELATRVALFFAVEYVAGVVRQAQAHAVPPQLTRRAMTRTRARAADTCAAPTPCPRCAFQAVLQARRPVAQQRPPQDAHKRIGWNAGRGTTPDVERSDHCRDAERPRRRRNRDRPNGSAQVRPRLPGLCPSVRCGALTRHGCARVSGTGHRNKTAATFSTAVVLNYYFEQAQHLRIGVYDVDDFHTDAQKQSVSRFQLIGQAEALLGEIVGGGGGTTLLRDLMHPDHHSHNSGNLRVRAQEVRPGPCLDVSYVATATAARGREEVRLLTRARARPHLAIHVANAARQVHRRGQQPGQKG